MVVRRSETVYPYISFILFALAFVILLVTIYPYYQLNQNNTLKIIPTSTRIFPTPVKSHLVLNKNYDLEFEYPGELSLVGPYSGSEYTLLGGDWTHSQEVPQIDIIATPRTTKNISSELTKSVVISPSGLHPQYKQFKKEHLGSFDFYHLETERFEGFSRSSYLLLSDKYIFHFKLSLYIGWRWTDPNLNISNEYYYLLFRQMLSSVVIKN